MRLLNSELLSRRQTSQNTYYSDSAAWSGGMENWGRLDPVSAIPSP
jgi:hypothetical protein